MKALHKYLLVGFVLFITFTLLTQSTREPFFGMSPGTLTQLQTSHVPTMPAPGLMPELLLVPLQHRFKPWDMPRSDFGAANAALEQTPMPYLIY